MMKNIFMSLFILGLVGVEPVHAITDQNTTFCDRDAEKYLKALSDLDQATLHKIEEKKVKYNQNLAAITLATAKPQIMNRSEILTQFLNEYKKKVQEAFERDSKANLENITFDNVCENNTSLRLCLLLRDNRDASLRTPVDETIKNLRLAILNSEVPSKALDVIPDKIEIGKDGIVDLALTDDEISKLKPAPGKSPIEPEEQQKLLNEINALYKNPQFSTNEKLKEFIGQRYLRLCNGGKVDSENTRSCPVDPTPVIMNLKIADESFKIVGALSSQEGEASTFSKAEIASYKAICDQNKSEEKYSDDCKLVYEEYNKTKSVKESKDWAAINRDYYVNADGTLTKKAGLGELVRDGLAPVVAQAAPAFIQVYQSNVAIYAMTQQAMAIKQSQVMYDAMAQGYYNANYIPTAANPSLSNGFNFGP